MVLCVTSKVTASTYNAYDDFSTTSNPNGTWSYGTTPTLGGSFSTLDDPINWLSGDLVGWGPAGAGDYPFVIVNPTATDSTYGYAAETMSLHPSNSGDYAVLRWTAPGAGNYTIDASFFDVNGGSNTDPATVDVHVLHNNSSIFSDNLDNSTTLSDFTIASIMLGINDTIDFVVGAGGNGYAWDHTQLEATISAVPIPAAAWLFGSGLLGLIGYSKRKQAA